MGKFDGILICSDIDGTYERGSEYEKYTPNVEAAKYFVQNGGKFTFSTGRQVSYLRKDRFASVMNAPASAFNGTVIYDYDKEKLLYHKQLPFTNEQIIEELSPYKDCIIRLNCCYDIDADIDTSIGFEQPTDLLKEHSIKIVCATRTVEDALKLKSVLKNSPLTSECYVNRSWSWGVEIIPSDSTKGQALEFIKAYLGDIHTSIGIGNYENDLPLIQYADIGITVENAVPELKAAADYVLCDYEQFAIKEFIEKLESGEIKTRL